jgi:hypothetical protein
VLLSHRIESLKDLWSQFWDIGQVLEENFDWLPFTPPPSGRLLQSFNWYQSQFGQQLALTGFVT